tara:strand:+ start:102 stop:611 length:510 start_codon:yes stop_codon:yes gene_type:complete
MSKYPLFHEKQRGKWCGLHSLNNSLQYIAFTEDDVQEAVKNIREQELQWANISRDSVGLSLSNCNGNLDISVIRHLLESIGIQTVFVRTYGQALRLMTTHPTQRKAVICAVPGHFFALTHYQCQWYLHDSLSAAPEKVYLYDIFKHLLPKLASGRYQRLGLRFMYFNIL